MEKGQKYRASFLTLGCRVSQYETEAIRERMLSLGFCDAERGERADCVLINTCTVTAEADRKSAKAIRRAIRENPNAVILVIGCYSEASSEEVAAIPGVSYVSGTADKMKTAEEALRLLSLRDERAKGEEMPPPTVSVAPLEGAIYEPMKITHPPHPRTRAYVKIADGCDWRCAYCAISAARGPVRSRPPHEIVDEVKRLSAGGTKEVVLTGIETASYGRDLDGYRLIDLMEEVDRLPIERLRLGSLTPEVLTDDFIARASRLRTLMPHFHLSLQSGSDVVLRLMRRRYTATAALQSIEKLRAAILNLQLSADIIVGFPGESKENFAETMAFAKKANFLHMHIFSYSKRRGTPASDFAGQISPVEKKERNATLTLLGERMRDGIFQKAIDRGTPLPVLFESCEGGLFSGHTDSFLSVLAEGKSDPRGTIRFVIPTGMRDGFLIGKIKNDI